MHAHAHHHQHASGASDCHGLHDSHGHHHAPADFGNAFLIGIGLNIIFVVIEGAAGLIYGSMALVADAGHNLSDVLALVPMTANSSSNAAGPIQGPSQARMAPGPAA